MAQEGFYADLYNSQFAEETSVIEKGLTNPTPTHVLYMCRGIFC